MTAGGAGQSMVVLGLCLLLVGCPHRRSDAVKTLTTQLSARQQCREKSLALYRKGLDAYRASLRDKAQEYLAGSVAEDERNAHAWMALGVVEFERDRLFEAAHAFHRAARLAPDRYEPHFNLGMLMESVGRYAQAITAYEKALTLSVDQTEVMENLARCYLVTNQNSVKAKELVDRALLSERRPEWRAWLERQSRLLAAKTGLPR